MTEYEIMWRPATCECIFILTANTNKPKWKLTGKTKHRIIHLCALHEKHRTPLLAAIKHNVSFAKKKRKK